MAMTLEQQKEAQELLRSYLEIYDGYNNQKEAVMVAFAAFYLGGATALLGFDHPFWVGSTRATFIASGLTVFALFLGLRFVRWASDYRRAAGEVYRACIVVLTKWVAAPPTDADVQPELYEAGLPLVSGFWWPRTLAAQIREIRNARTRGWWPPRDLPSVAMVVWTVAVLWRILTV